MLETMTAVHPAQVLTGGSFTEPEQLTFNLRYVGSAPVGVSMKTLDFAVRTALAKECIFRVCEAAGFVSMRRHKAEKTVRALLPPGAELELVGCNVVLRVDTDAFDVRDEDGAASLFRHDLPNVSFASGGEDETADFVAFIAKDARGQRRCFVFECGARLATAVLQAIQTAFTDRLQQLHGQGGGGCAALGSPPTSAPTTPSSLLPPPLAPSVAASVSRGRTSAPIGRGAFGGVASYENDVMMCESLLLKEPWYHGPLERAAAERLLRRDGDFLVRQSTSNAWQFVLSGLQSGAPKHLLLIDDKGKVRTRDRQFQNISHLIQYHRDNNIPITSAESALLLRFPAIRQS